MTYEERIKALESSVQELNRHVKALLISATTVTDLNQSAVHEAVRHVQSKGDRMAREIMAERKAYELQSELQMLAEDWPNVARILHKENT